jgi:hypothetical protein
MVTNDWEQLQVDVNLQCGPGKEDIYLAYKGDGWGKEDADLAAWLADEMTKLINQQHGNVRLTASCPKVHYDVLLHSPLAEIQLILARDRPRILRLPPRAARPRRRGCRGGGGGVAHGWRRKLRAEATRFPFPLPKSPPTHLGAGHET